MSDVPARHKPILHSHSLPAPVTLVLHSYRRSYLPPLSPRANLPTQTVHSGNGNKINPGVRVCMILASTNV